MLQLTRKYKVPFCCSMDVCCGNCFAETLGSALLPAPFPVKEIQILGIRAHVHDRRTLHCYIICQSLPMRTHSLRMG